MPDAGVLLRHRVTRCPKTWTFCYDAPAYFLGGIGIFGCGGLY